MNVERRRLRKRAKALEQLVRRAVNMVDPIGLLSLDAPENEYDPEVERIVGGLMRIGPQQAELTALVQSVFDTQFGAGSALAPACERIAEHICHDWTGIMAEED